MFYEKIKKGIAFVLLFIFFFGQITGLSFLSFLSNVSYAQNKEYHDLVSIIVDEKTYKILDKKIKRYAEDIQRYLDNTKVVILPIKKTNTAFEIASLNESLFYEGYKSLKKGITFESRLVGTILIGDFPIPIVTQNGKVTKSIVPYVDFEDKKYIFNPKTKLFEENTKNLDGLKAEIWEGVISPNTGTFSGNIKEIENFLDKDHDFYTGKGLFDKSKGVLNGKLSDEIPNNYEPYVFYFDGIREQKSLHYVSYKGYEAYLNNKEDIIYHRYTRDLAKRIKDDIMKEANKEISELVKKLPKTNKLNTSVARAQYLLLKSGQKKLASQIGKKDLFGRTDDLGIVNDIATRVIIKKATNKFIQVFNKGTIADFRKNVHNAGRYNKTENKINIDLIPSIISILDLVSDKVSKAANNKLENKIDSLVKNKLAKKIKNIPEKRVKKEEKKKNKNDKLGRLSSGGGGDGKCEKKIEYTNYYYGKKASDLKNTYDCTIYRGSYYNSGQIIEANRGLNIKNIENDIKGVFYYNGNQLAGICSGEEVGHTQGIYAGSTPVNIEMKKGLTLKKYDLNKAVLPIFDIAGSKKTTNNSKNPSPKDCLVQNWIKTYENFPICGGDGDYCVRAYSVLGAGAGAGVCSNTWSCRSININETPQGDVSGTKTIPSYMIHKSPTPEEYNKELRAGITPNLPVDKDRYIDFFAKEVDALTGSGADSYVQIFYPNLFRVKGKTKEEVEENLNKLLEEKTNEIKQKAKKSGVNLDNFDLKKFLKEVIVKEVEIKGEKKKFSFYDFTVFAIYWNNLNNVSSKYKFVLENYLSDQVGGNQFDFVLANNKKMYEVAYLGNHGDARNMYVKMDAKAKVYNPYSKTFNLNANFRNFSLGVGIINHNAKFDFSDKGKFKCAPPDGVPIWKWIPAVICRLKSLLPPKIGIEWVCGPHEEKDKGDIGEENKGEYENGKLEDLKCEFLDENKNGINDCLENAIKGAKLKLSGDRFKYHFLDNGKLRTELIDKNGKLVYVDNYSFIDYYLEKIVDKETGKVVFDAAKDDFKDSKDIIKKYVFFFPVSVRSVHGRSYYRLSTQRKEADLYFRAKLSLKPTVYAIPKLEIKGSGYNPKVTNTNKLEILSSNLRTTNIKSNIFVLKVRYSKLFLDGMYTDENSNLEIIKDSIEASDKTNVYLIGNNKDFKDYSYNKNSLVLKLISRDRKKKNKKIDFPIYVNIKDEYGRLVKSIKYSNLNGLKELVSLTKTGKYTINIVDNFGFESDFYIKVRPSKESKLQINLGSNYLSKTGITNNLVSVYDRFGNIVLGKIFDYKIKIKGDSVTFENTKKELNLSSFEGYELFRLKANNKLGTSNIIVELYNSDGNKVLQSSKKVTIIDDLKIDLKIEGAKKLKVGRNKYTAILIFKNRLGKKLNLNSRVYLKVAGKYIVQEKPYVNIVNGEARIVFKTGILAGEDIGFDFRVEGFEDVITKYENIYPEKPMSLYLLPTKSKLEADPKAYTNIKVLLKDIYRNTVFTDNDSKIDLELRDEYSDILKPVIKQLVLKKGEANFRVYATEFPGTAYLKFKINKKLEDNVYTVGQGKKKVEQHGVSENALKLETFYFYKKEKITGKKYNALYTTLLGANYGDITEKNYLASGMLFDKNNRSLAVTSLLNNPYRFFDAITISTNGILQKVNTPGDLTQDVSVELIKDRNGSYYLDLFNNALNIHIGKIYLNFSKLNITDEVYKELEKSKVDLSIFGIKDFKIAFAGNDTILNSMLKIKTNYLIIYLDTPEYFLRQDRLKNNKQFIAISYNDPFANKYVLNEFARDSYDTYDNFIKNAKLGWGGGNKTLLEFASGVGAGESVRKYMGVSVITLGDPVISLKKIPKISYGIKKKFDSSLGKKLNKTDIKGYRIFDYNADNRDDILLIKYNGFLKLLENKDSSLEFLNQKHLIRIFDLGRPELLLTGDFSGDSYDDIFFVDNKGRPNIFDNKKKDFIRYSLEDSFKLKGKIIQARSFDMDADGIDDIVTLDDFGEINIFYGRRDSIIKFDKKLVYSGYGIKLNKNIRNDLGAIFFEGLAQKGLKNKNLDDAKDYYPFEFLENAMFDTLSYDLDTDRDKENYTKTTKFLRSEFAPSIGIDIKKTYIDINSGSLQQNDLVKVKVIIKNNTRKTFKNVVYAEDVPKFFKMLYSTIEISKKGIKTRKRLGKYEFYLDKFTLAPGEELTVKYSMKTRGLVYKYILVGLFEKGEAGDDKYGDIIVKDSPYNCGGNYDIFRSTARRTYRKGIKKVRCDTRPLPEILQKNDIDKDGNGIPDYIDKIINDPNERKRYAENAYNDILEGDIIEDDESMDSLNSIDNALDELEEEIEGFNCGFGSDSCIGYPINWAPLAPGNDPVIYGKLVGDGLKIDEGIPVFSALTWKYSGHSCHPSVFPVSSKSVGCAGKGAGGYLGINSPTNYFRFFVTPTITGSYGIAACFGAPASEVGQDPPKGLNPVVPGGNCIVRAKKLDNGCKDDVPGVPPVGPPIWPDDDLGIVNGNCEHKTFSNLKVDKLPITNKINTKLAREYLEARKGQKIDSKLKKDYENLLKNMDNIGDEKDDAILNQDDVGVTNDENGADFENAEEINNKKVPGFPDFITGWVDQQLNEFITKLADFPNLYIKLPEFKGTLNGKWGKYADELSQDSDILQQTSGIQETYKFLGNIPFVNLEMQPIYINIPWAPNMEATMSQWKGAIGQWGSEINRVAGEAKDLMRPGNIVKVQKFRNSLRQNMQAIKSYMELPDKIADLAGKKQKRLEQIMCYINELQDMTLGWMERNGKRFKAWVELFTLIKGILKSWQALADVFIDYDAQCHECKNERHDSLGAQFQLVSMITPKLPVIKFPKWPDILLDLHNIRIGLNLQIPELKFSKRPLNLPGVPQLQLPSLSECINFDIELPALPTLPMIQLPELPDLPAIPKIILPDLPPPPKLPKMFGSLEGMTKIMELITKAMCILKKLPFVPEIRAGDQIAFLTEGAGYRGSFKGGSFDFMNMKMPEFSFPFVDEIQVIVYVNLEFDTDFLSQMVKAMVEPLNKMTSNFVNMFGGMGMNLDFSGLCKKGDGEGANDNIEADIQEDIYKGTFKPEIEEEQIIDKYKRKIREHKQKQDKYYDPNSINHNGTNKVDIDWKKVEKKQDNKSSFRLTPLNLAKAFSFGLQQFNSCINVAKNKEVSTKEFIKYVNKQLASDYFNKPMFDELKKSFYVVNNYTYSKEDKIITDLKKQNLEKYETIRNIIKEELRQTKELKEKIKNNFKYIKISDQNLKNKQKVYNSLLDKHNKNFIDAAIKLKNPSYFDINGLKRDANNLKNRIHNGISNFEKENLSSDSLLAMEAPKTELAFRTGEQTQCVNSRLYRRKYRGIYIIQSKKEKNNKETSIYYRLFEYLDDLNGREVIKYSDFDKDGDKDIVYMMNNNLYLKKNLINKKKVKHLSGVDVVRIDDNKFLNGAVFYEAVNNTRESFVANGYLNISFSASKNTDLNNYRLSFYQIIDKYQNIGNKNYVPKNVKKYVIDSFVASEDLSKQEENLLYIKRKNLAYIDEIGNNIGKVVLKTKKLINIKNSLKSGNLAIIGTNKKLYSGNKPFEIEYIKDGKVEKLILEPHSNIELKMGLKVVSITGDAYLMSDVPIILKGRDILKYLGLPLDFDSKIVLYSNDFIPSSGSHITIKYYDGSEAKIDFRKIKYYSIYDLGAQSNDYGITLKIKNDFYYARMQSFRKNIFSTKTSQVLLSPQIAADKYSPEIKIRDSIRIPVYQKRIIDLTDAIYENSGVDGIKSFEIEGLPKTKAKIKLSKFSIKAEFGKFNKIFTKKIKFIVTDENDNTTQKDVKFEVYTPIPQINFVTKTGSILGYINENLTDEPINIYRLRGGIVKKVFTINNKTKVPTKDGKYLFNANIGKNNKLEVKYKGKLIFEIDEYTGKILNLDNKYLVDSFVDKDNFINIVVKEKITDLVVFKEKIDLTKNTDGVIYYKDFNSIDSNGLYLRLKSNLYDYYKIPKTTAYNPGAFVIFRKKDSKKTPLFVIMPDAKLKLYNSFYKISYSSYKIDSKDYVMIKLIDKHYNKVVGELLFKVKNEFLIR